jgi:hypothetical protein
MNRFLALALALALAVPAAAQQKGTAGRLGGVAPFLDELTVAVVRIDLTRLKAEALTARVRQLGDLDKGDVAKTHQELTKALEALSKAKVHELYMVFGLDGFPPSPASAEPFLVGPLGSEEAAKEAAETLQETFHEMVEPIGKAVVIGNELTRKRLHDLKPASHPGLAKGFAAAGDKSIQAVVLLPKSLRRSLEEVLPNLPEPVGGSIKPFTQGFSWATAGLDLTPKLSLQVTLQARDAESAKELAGLYHRVFKVLVKEERLRKELPNLERIGEMLAPRVQGNQLTVSLGDADLTAMLKPLVAKLRGAAARQQSINNLKQHALAMHQYLDDNKHFPTHASYDKQGRPLLSWRVLILPQIGEKELYDEFKLDEPWDSAHNKKLIAKMPQAFRNPRSKSAPGKTTYMVLVGKETMFPPGSKGLRIADVTDGTSNTILVVEGDDDHAVTWTRPDDLRYDPQQPLRGLGGRKDGNFLAAFADGSVHAIARTIALDTLRALVTPAGNEVVGDF